MPSTTRVSSPSPAAQMRAFIDKFDPAVAKLLRACRTTMRKRMPTALELVYDNYNFFVIGYCSTPKASDCIVSLATSAKGVGLCFIHGAKLPDPKGLLMGSGNQTRFIRLPSAAVLKTADVEALLRAAIVRAKTPLPKSGKGSTVIKSISAKQRPRRAASAKAPAAKRAVRN
jgi:hypothetical protein